VQRDLVVLKRPAQITLLFGAVEAPIGRVILAMVAGMSISEENQRRLAKYEAKSGPALIGLALLYVVVYGVPIVWTTMPPGVAALFTGLNVLIWAAFVVDLGLRAHLSRRPVHYLLRHPIDLVLVLVPMLRVLRVLRIFTAANYLVSRGGVFAVGRTVASAVAATLFLMVVAALAMLDAERTAVDSGITTFGDALWWAGATVTTVGYGDAVPVTAVGRAVAFALMLVGISMLGVVTASVAAWFVARTRRDEVDLVEEVRLQRAEIAELRELVRALGPSQTQT
jgi:voltage-gated potassium channel